MSNIVKSDNHYEMDRFRFIDYEPGRRDYIGVWITQTYLNGRKERYFERLLNVEELEEKMLRDPKLKDYEWEEFYRRYEIAEVLQKIFISLAQLHTKASLGKLKVISDECKDYLETMFYQKQDEQLDATPDDWYWDILPTEIKERVLK